MFDQALQFREENTVIVNSYDEFKSIIKDGGFIRCGWNGEANSEAAVKADTKATIRCILTDGKIKGLHCLYSGDPARYEVIFARAY